MSPGYSIYNTGTTNQTMFALGTGLKAPTTVTSYITNSDGTQRSTPSPNPTPVTSDSSGLQLGTRFPNEWFSGQE